MSASPGSPPKLPPPSPPRLASRFLSAMLGDDEFADSVVGDLTEEWLARIAWRARCNRLWYGSEALAIASRFAIAERLGRRRRSHLVRSAPLRLRHRTY